MDKKKIIGADYVNGTWVGYYIGVDGQVRFFFEKYEQAVDGLLIKGSSLNENLKPHASWNSSSYLIDNKKGTIAYVYEVRPLREQIIGEGIAFFNFERKASDIPPEALSGYTLDTHIGVRVTSQQTKISAHTDYDKDLAFEKAQAFFNGTLANN